MTAIFDTGYKTYRNFLAERLLIKECRLKNLRDICLEYIGKNLHCITRASQYLAPIHKELMIERLGFHDLLTPEYLPHVTYNLFSDRLTRVNFYCCDQIDENLLKLLASSGCKLRHLTLHRCNQVTDGAVLAITKSQSELRTLELRKLKLSARGLQNVRSPHLETLDLRGCLTLTTPAVQSVVAANPSIKYLNLVNCSKLTEEVFQHIAKSLGKNLEVLDIADTHCLQDNGLMCLAEHCPNMTRINLLGCNKLSNTSLTKLFQCCPQLHSLDLSYCSGLIQNPPSAQTLMNSLTNSLQELSLNGLQLEDSALIAEGLGRLSQLTKLRLCGVPGLNDECLHGIMQKVGSRLEYFDICGSVMSPLTDRGLESISRYCQRLSTLGLSLLKGVTGRTLLPLLEDHKRAHRFTRLLLCVRQLDPAVITAVTENCHSLQLLDVSGLSQVTDATLSTLANNCSQLSDIYVKACRNVTDAGIEALAVHCPLCVVVLSGLHSLTDHSIRVLTNNIQWCDNYCYIPPQVTDAGIEALAVHCPLCVVVLSGLHSLTDHSIRVLANNCPYLEELYISGCDNVSTAAVNYLKDVCIPRVCVSHRVPNARNTAHNLDTGNYDTY